MYPKAYNDIYKGKSKKTRGCLTMGFNIEGKQCIERAANNLKLFGAKFTINLV